MPTTQSESELPMLVGDKLMGVLGFQPEIYGDLHYFAEQIAELKGIPFIVVSSLDAETEMPKARAKGFAGFISKPINAIQFPEQIAACLEGGRFG